MTAYHHHPRPIVVQIVSTVVGLLAGLLAALASTRGLTLRADPVGLVGTWACFLAVCAALGWMFGTEWEELHHQR